MKKNLLLFLFIAAVNTLFAQTTNDTISMVKRNNGRVAYMKGGIPLLPIQLEDVMYDYPESMRYLQKAKTNQVFGIIFAATGGYLIGYPLGTAIGGGDPNWSMAAIGAGVVAIAFVFDGATKSNIRDAVEAYNRSVREKNSSLSFGFTPSGIGFRLAF